METWNPVSIVPTLLPGILHLWYLSLQNINNQAQAKFATCSQEEYIRASTSKQPHKCMQFLYIRSWLRHIIGNYLKVAPQQVQIDYNYHGKPFITWPQPAPHFNISHSDSLCLLAVYWDAAIGVDVELIRPRLGIKNIAQRCFNSNIMDELNNLSENEMLHRFYYHWTIFEAKLKAQGGSVFDITKYDMYHIETISFIPETGFQGCVAAMGNIPKQNCWQRFKLVI